MKTKLTDSKKHPEPRAIFLDDPNIGKLEKKYLEQCIDSTFVSTYGPFVPEFEEKFSRFIDTKKAVSLQSGTAGLHIALHELGIKQGDEVIVPVLTFIATANTVRYTGAKPVFVDVDPKTWVMEPSKIKKAITKSTRAIVPVHLFGIPCKMDEIMEIAKRHRLFVVEDATESLGSKYQGRFTGTFGDFGVFSFNGNKLMTTGGGGMIVGNDDNLLSHIGFLINQARHPEKGYYHTEVGFNYRMTNLEASLGLAQFERIEEFMQKKRNTTKTYIKKFQGIDHIRLQECFNESETVRWLNAVIINTEGIGQSISDIQNKLLVRGIPTRKIFTPITEFPPYRETDASKYSNAYKIYKNGLCLPSSTLNTSAGINYAAANILSLIRNPIGPSPSISCKTQGLPEERIQVQ